MPSSYLKHTIAQSSANPTPEENSVYSLAFKLIESSNEMKNVVPQPYKPVFNNMAAYATRIRAAVDEVRKYRLTASQSKDTASRFEAGINMFYQNWKSLEGMDLPSIRAAIQSLSRVQSIGYDETASMKFRDQLLAACQALFTTYDAVRAAADSVLREGFSVDPGAAQIAKKDVASEPVVGNQPGGRSGETTPAASAIRPKYRVLKDPLIGNLQLAFKNYVNTNPDHYDDEFVKQVLSRLGIPFTSADQIAHDPDNTYGKKTKAIIELLSADGNIPDELLSPLNALIGKYKSIASKSYDAGKSEATETVGGAEAEADDSMYSSAFKNSYTNDMIKMASRIARKYF